MSLVTRMYSSLIGREGYRNLSENVDSDSGELLEEKLLPASYQAVKYYFLCILTTINLAVFGISLFLFLSRNSAGWQYQNRRNQILKASSYYSPLLDELDIPLRTVNLNGTLADEEETPSIFRQAPSPEVDAAWNRISMVGFHVISSADVIKIGKDPSKTVRAPLDWGYGVDAHLAQLDVFHQIHCLNVLRRHMYPAYYTEDWSILNDLHPMHCLHMLLQNLMCEASVDMITSVWMETQKHPYPDMSINRQCRDFEAVLEWNQENKVPGMEKKMKVIQMPGGAVPLPLSPQLRKLIEADDTKQRGKSGGD